MGKSGKYGNGKTLRSSFIYEKRVAEGLVARVVKGTIPLSRPERRKFTEEFNSPDGLRGLDDVFTRDVHERGLAEEGASVYYSLGKRGRWSLPQHLKDDARDGCYESGRLAVVERYLPSNRASKAADCICVTDSRAEVKCRTPRKTYSRFQDLLTVTNVGPEVCYEISYPHSADSWANFTQSKYSSNKWDRGYPQNPKKAATKNKGVRNKGKRWGMYSEHDLKTIGRRGLHDFPSSSRRNKESLKKIQLSDPKKFKNSKKSQQKQYPLFDLGNHIDDLIRKGSPSSQMTAKPAQVQDPTPVQKFGKKSVIYIDAPPPESEPQAVTTCPVVFKPEVKYIAEVDVPVHDLMPAHLEKEWGTLYTEGASLPRKFTIDATGLLQKPHETGTNSHICQLLFQETGRNGNNPPSASLTVSLIGSSLDNPEFCNDKIAADFSGTLEENKNTQEQWSVHDLVELGAWTFSKHTVVEDHIHPDSGRSQKSMPLKILSDLFGWRSTPLSPTCAKAELWQSLEKIQASPLADGLADLADYACPATPECGICYQDLYDEGSAYTALAECQHAFCNDCWEAHLKTQISRNTMRILCPEFKCDCPVDSVTVMSVIPSWYNKYLSRRIDNALEVSPEWERCPTDRCHQVIKATLLRSGELKKAFPVVCSCGGLWCFKCRKQAHWPITCEEADSYDKMTRRYLETAVGDADKLITSVFVRKCPKCSYPIEKHLGCNFMYCVLCNTSFCWDCMTPWSVHGDECKSHAQSDEIDLTVEIHTDRFTYYANMVRKNALAKHTPLITHQKQNLQLIQRNVESFQALQPITKANLQKGGIQQLQRLMDARALGILDMLFQFKYEAHLTLEGAAKVAAMSSKTEKQLRCPLHQLHFIVDRIAEVLKQGFSTVIKEENQQKVEHFVMCGKKCIYSIGKALSRRV